MGFHEAKKVWYGDDARRIRSVARQALIDWLDDALNDADGPYYEPLELTEERQAIVTGSREHASALFDGLDSTPVVFVMVGPSEWTPYGATISGVGHKGKRHDLTFILDMGINQTRESAENPVTEHEKDAEFADFVFDAISENAKALSDLGLHGIVIQPDAEQQRAGNGRNPHTVNCFVITLDDFAG